MCAALTVLSLASCSSKEKAHFSLYVKNMSGQKEKIADFYQQAEGMDDCESVKKKWARSYSASCEIN